MTYIVRINERYLAPQPNQPGRTVMNVAEAGTWTTARGARVSLGLAWRTWGRQDGVVLRLCTWCGTEWIPGEGRDCPSEAGHHHAQQPRPESSLRDIAADAAERAKGTPDWGPTFRAEMARLAQQQTPTPFDYASLDEGIRETVRWLHERGFATTDSGDGSKTDAMDCAVPFPMVTIQVAYPSYLDGEARRLLGLLQRAGVTVAPGNIQATYDPVDNVAAIVLCNVTIDSSPAVPRDPRHAMSQNVSLARKEREHD